MVLCVVCSAGCGIPVVHMRFGIVSGLQLVRIGSVVCDGVCCVRGGYMMYNDVIGVCRCGTYCGVCGVLIML